MVLIDIIKTKNAGKVLLLVLILTSCSSLRKASEIIKKTPESVAIYIGESQGGFIEESEIDAISGATNIIHYEKEDPGMNFFAGTRVQYKISKRGRLESGFDFISHQQCLVYHDPSLGFEGKLYLDYNRISMPISYNFGIFQNKHNEPIISLKTGLSLNYIHEKNVNITGNVPDFLLKKFAVSPYFGLSITPLNFKRFTMGLFFNSSLLKGTKVFYDNTYHKSNNTGLLSTMELGCSFNLKLSSYE